MKTGTNKTQKPKKSKIVLRILGFILLGFVALIVLIIIFAPKSETETETKTTDSTTAVVSLSENDAEIFCQDAALLKKYIDTTKIKVIDVLNYNKYYTETGDKDSSGKDIMQLTWNGKQGDETLGFTCWVSGTKSDTILHKLSMNGDALYIK